MSKRRVLFHVMPSYYSAIARLLLAEKQLAYQSVMLDMHIGIEYFEPWYVTLNPNITVPTLLDGDKCLTSSDEMLDYIDEHYDEIPLKPSDPSLLDDMRVFLKAHHAIRIENLTMGTLLARKPSLQKRMMALLKKQLILCDERGEAYPALKTAYDKKRLVVQNHLDAFCLDNMNKTRDSGEKEVIAYLLQLESHLKEKGWLLGEQYTLCDIVSTSLLARLEMINRLDMLNSLPKSQAYYERLKARSSFKKAGIPIAISASDVLKPLFYRWLRKAHLLPTVFR